jgi:hypothetical protein
MPEPESSEPSDEAVNPGTTTAPTPTASTSPPAAPPVARGPALRRALLSKLPRLAESAQDLEKTVTSDAELGALTSLSADAFLEPLEDILAPGQK